MSPCSAPGCRCTTPCILWCGPDTDTDTEDDDDGTVWDGGLAQVLAELDPLTRMALADSLLTVVETLTEEAGVVWWDADGRKRRTCRDRASAELLAIAEGVGSEPTATATELPTDGDPVESARDGVVIWRLPPDGAYAVEWWDAHGGHLQRCPDRASAEQLALDLADGEPVGSEPTSTGTALPADDPQVGSDPAGSSVGSRR